MTESRPRGALVAQAEGLGRSVIRRWWGPARSGRLRPVPLAALLPAAVAHGVAVVMTGTGSVSDSRRLITGIAAPPLRSPPRQG